MIAFLSAHPFYLLQAAAAAFTLFATLSVSLATVHEANSENSNRKCAAAKIPAKHTTFREENVVYGEHDSGGVGNAPRHDKHTKIEGAPFPSQ
jgi:hypothetical protein